MGSSQKATLLGSIPFGTAIAQNDDFFGTDIVIPLDGNYGKKLIIQGVFTSSKVLEITLNGSDFVSAGSKSTLWQEEVFVYDGDILNFRCPDGGGVTVSFFRVDLVD